MMVKVVISRATRVPCLSLALSTLDRHPTTYRGPEDALTMTVNDGLAWGVLWPWVSRHVTSLVVQLLEDLANNLANTLQRLDIVLGLIKIFLQALNLQPQGLQFCLPFARLDQLCLE